MFRMLPRCLGSAETRLAHRFDFLRYFKTRQPPPCTGGQTLQMLMGKRGMYQIAARAGPNSDSSPRAYKYNEPDSSAAGLRSWHVVRVMCQHGISEP